MNSKASKPIYKVGAFLAILALFGLAQPLMASAVMHTSDPVESNPSCFIAVGSPIEITYLHGWRNEMAAYQRSHSNSLRAIQVAQSQCGFSFSAPDSPWICDSPIGEVQCWNRGNWNQRMEVSEFVKNKSEDCFGSKTQEKIRILFGFSDGAYFLNKMQSEFLDQFDHIVISGGPKAKLNAKEIKQNPNHSVSAEALIEFLQNEVQFCY